MAVLVLDASLAASWCFQDEVTDYTESVLAAVSGNSDAIAPRLWAYELRNSVLMGLRRQRITRNAADAFLKSLPLLHIRLTDPPSYDDVFALGEHHGLTAYDAAYLDLAIREGLPIASLDKKLMSAATKCGIDLYQP